MLATLLPSLIKLKPSYKMNPSANEIIDEFQKIQNEICFDLTRLDGVGQFEEDIWHRSSGGGGKTRIIEGQIIEKGGVNFSHVYGEVSDEMRKAMKMDGAQWLATGVSIVLHPVSPMVPIIHMNIRYFELDGGREWWFGGGIDLTPHYIDPVLAGDFHRQLKAVCDRFDMESYAKYKSWADDYFYLPHREETRGVGGIFFDRLNASKGHQRSDIFRFVTEVGRAFSSIYKYQVDRTIDLPYGERELAWQGLRRGRYVEFNLVWDKGTKFGLISNGRTESILMSLPKRAHWEYQYEPNDREQATLNLLKKSVDWHQITV